MNNQRLGCLTLALLSGGFLLGLNIFAQEPLKESAEMRAARHRMVEQELAREGITHKGVLDAMREVPRHRFVLPDYEAYAYQDRSLPIGNKQTITSPFVVAYMTQALDPKPTDRVLEIGTGSGYQAAILSRLVKEVYSVEIVDVLGREAGRRLTDLGYKNVRTKIGDGYQGWPEHAPFDKIVVTCSPESIPQPLADQLREGGTMLIPLGERFHQSFYLLEKQGGTLHKTRLAPTLFVPMTGLAEKLRQQQATPGPPRLVNSGFEQVTDGDPLGWVWKRAPEIRHAGAPEGKNYLALTNTDPGRSAAVYQAFAADGAKVQRLTVSLMLRGEGLKPGQTPQEIPSVVVGFADERMQPVGDSFLGPWQGTFGWRRVSGKFDVPSKAKVALLRISLNGGTGSLGVDDIRLESVPR